MDFTADHVEKAVSHFYQNVSTQSQLNMWLTSAQASSQAWIFSWILLDKSKVLHISVTLLNFYYKSCISLLRSSILEQALFSIKFHASGMKCLLSST